MAAKNVRQWFRIQNAATDPTVAEIHIIDAIGGWDDDWIARNFGYDMGVTARSFVEQLAALPTAVTTIRLHINSPGGDVQGGINIANALREQQVSKGRTVETYIDGIAASIASVIAMAGSKVVIDDNALFVLHNPWTAAMGNAGDMRKTADILDTIRGQIVNTYKWHSTLDDAAIIALMDAETWMNADEALANGFATAKAEGLKAAASINPKGLAKLKIPEKYRDRVRAFMAPARNDDPPPNESPDVMVSEAIGELQQVNPLLAGGSLEQVRQALGLLTEVQDEIDDAIEAVLQLIDTLEPGAAASLRASLRHPKPGPAAATEDVLRICREGGCLDLAEAFIIQKATLVHVTATVQRAKEAKAAESTRISTITALCGEFKQSELAAGYIAGGMPVDQVRAQLGIVRAKVDKVEIDANLDPDQGPARAVAGWKNAFSRVKRVSRAAGARQ